MANQNRNSQGRDPAASSIPLTSVYTNNLPAILDHFGISLVVSTYQAGKVILVRSDGGGINTHFRDFNKPMGIAVDGQRLTVGGQNTVWYFRNMPAVAPKLEPKGKHDAAYLPRQVHVTGDIDIHELAWGKEDLWIVNTRFCCLCTLEPDHSFTPRWRPHFVSALAPEDRCHLNGLAMVGGKPKYVTALGQTDTPGGWRANKRGGGVLMDVERNEVLLEGLSMPHSPRLWAGRLWLLESGQGSLAYADLPNHTWHTVATLPGFTRGIDFAGPLAFIGLSQVRETAVFSGIPLVERQQERICGVWVVNVETGETVAFLRFETGVQEIFAVQIVPARYPEMLEFGDEILNHSYVLPDAAMKDVPAVLQEPLPAAGPEQPAGFVEEINRGAARLDQDKVAEAIVHFERAKALAPERAEVYNNLGNVATAENRLHDAVAHYQHAIRLDPAMPDAHMNLGMALLKLGDLPAGFREFEWRWQTRQFTPFMPPHPRWDGSPLPGKTLLVHTEQGAGDAIQFVRFVQQARPRVGKVLLIAPDSLSALFATAAGVDEIRGAGAIAEQAFDVHIPLLSLPMVLGATLQTIPAQTPYLSVPPDRQVNVLRMGDGRPTTGGKSPLRVGIAWAGSPTQGNDRNRSARLADFAPLFEIPSIEWHSLQVGEKSDDLDSSFLIHHSSFIKDWADTAAIVSQLDLVISVDTGVAHLAGALGVPAWVLLCYAPDWRWLLERADSPWYPSARLFRQPRPKDWASVMAEAAAALRALAAR
ncbi:TIGR03032 family protein [Candidatus Amarolinea aalborgensis]|uniref:TIGR03032 family protein n=1 Tax=Candidatus Amarolinea aalborgensis TaxID=2249329 RepID=UPI003BFA3357